jgi:predicted dehydrogenase
MTKVKLGIIGAGKISDIHLKTFSKNKNVSLVSITDVNIALATEKAEKYGIQKVENSYLDVISDPGVDVVDILLPHYLHAKVSLKAIRKGKAIICEKPFVIKLEDAKKLIRETKKNKISMHLKHYLHYSLSHLKIKKMIQDGLIGKPYLVKCLYTCNSVNGMNDKNSWKGSVIEAGGGVLIDAGVHVVDFLQDIFGNPKSVSCECKQISTKLKSKGEDLAIMNIEFPGNVMAEITCTSNDTSYGFRWEKHIFGLEGSLHIIDFGKSKNEIVLYKDGNVVLKDTEEDWWNQASKNNLDDIIDRIIHKKRPAVDMRTAYFGLKTILRAYESAKIGKRLKI